MIKLIASDMDGTLADDNQKIDGGFYNVVQRLKSEGVLFAPASGRHVSSLKALFKDYLDFTPLIAGNGSYAEYKGEELYASVLSPKLARYIIETFSGNPLFGMVIDTREIAYTTDEKLFKGLGGNRFNYNIRLAKSFNEIDDDVLKISVMYKKGNVLDIYDKILPLFEGKCRADVSGYANFDIVNFGVSKGAALEALQKKLGVTKEQTMAFGDNYNDVEMFDKAYYSFAMKNAGEDIRKKARFVTRYTNNQNGVSKEIERIMNEV